MITLLLLTGLAIAEPPEDRQGEALYKAFCITCHKEKTSEGPYRYGITAEEKIKTVREGKGPMPPYGWIFNDDDIENIINYMDSIYKKD